MRSVEAIAYDVLACAEAWDPDARLVGNVRADELAHLARHMRAVQSLRLVERANVNGPFRAGVVRVGALVDDYCRTWWTDVDRDALRQDLAALLTEVADQVAVVARARALEQAATIAEDLTVHSHRVIAQTAAEVARRIRALARVPVG